jgi:hypothetical protein
MFWTIKMLIHVHYRLADHTVAQWLQIEGGDLVPVAMGGNHDALGGYTMNWTKYHWTNHQSNKIATQKKVCGHQIKWT